MNREKLSYPCDGNQIRVKPYQELNSRLLPKVVKSGSWNTYLSKERIPKGYIRLMADRASIDLHRIYVKLIQDTVDIINSYRGPIPVSIRHELVVQLRSILGVDYESPYGDFIRRIFAVTDWDYTLTARSIQLTAKQERDRIRPLAPTWSESLVQAVLAGSVYLRIC